MPTTNSVWISISCEELSDRIKEKIDRGLFEDAQSMSYAVTSFLDKISKFFQSKGGHLYINLIDRQIIETTDTVAEEIPNIIEGYKEILGNRVAVGLGLTFNEATLAMQMSRYSGEIELYDSTDPKFKQNESGHGYAKAETESQQVNLPHNIFDPLTPKPNFQESDHLPKFRPSVQEEFQSDTKFIQSMAQQFAPPPPPPPQQQPNQNQSQDLLEALHGGKVPGHSPSPEQQQPKQKPKTGNTNGAPEDDDDHAHISHANTKLGELLTNVSSYIPQIMALEEKNPQAYKNAMKLIHKLLEVAKKRKTNKSEQESELEELNKRIKRKLPVGSVVNRRKKVLINGREVWRSVSAGQVMDTQGEAISVKSSNYQAEGKGDR
jgi:hypothetical protein